MQCPCSRKIPNSRKCTSFSENLEYLLCFKETAENTLPRGQSPVDVRINGHILPSGTREGHYTLSNCTEKLKETSISGDSKCGGGVGWAVEGGK